MGIIGTIPRRIHKLDGVMFHVNLVKLEDEMEN